MNLILFYITCSNVEEAQSITNVLIQEKLIACANIIPQIISTYKWQNEIKNETESVLILKMTKENQYKVEQRVKELHSYTIPCILQFETSNVNKDFSNWLDQTIFD